MRIDREEALRRLNSPNNLAGRFSERPSVSPTGPPQVGTPAPEKKGRGVTVPEGQRDLIARAALLQMAPQEVIGRHFGVTQENVSQCKTGNIGGRPLNSQSETRKTAQGKRVEEIRDLALEKTLAALGLADNAKLENLEVKELGRFAKDMAAVYNSLGPKDTIEANKIQFMIYAPQVQKEDKYKVVDI